MKVDVVHQLFVLVHGFIHLGKYLSGYRTEGHISLKILCCLIETTTGKAVEYLGKKRTFLQGRVGNARIFALFGVGIENFRLEPYRFLVERQSEEMSAQLLGGVMLQKLVCRRRLHRARGRSLLVAKQDMVIGNEFRLLQFAFRSIGNHGLLFLKGGEQCRLGNAVEIQVVLTNELIHRCIFFAPERAPCRARKTAIIVARHGEGKRSPKAFGPAPYREAVHPFDFGNRHAPFNVAGNTEWHQCLTGAEANVRIGQHGTRFIAIEDILEFDLEALLALGGIAIYMLRQFVCNFQVFVMQFHLDVDDGRNQKFLDGFGNNGTNARIAFQGINVIANHVGQARQVEVPISHLAHFRHRARNRRNRLDKINRVVLVAQVAFIGIGFFAFAALHGAMPHHLTAIQEHAFLSVIELKGAFQMQESLFVKTLHKGGRN